MNAIAASAAQLRPANLSDPAQVAAIEAFVAEQRGSVFQRPAWLAAVARGTGQTALGLVVEQGGTIRGWLPLIDVHSPLFGRALVSSGFGVGGGALAPRGEDAHALCRGAEELALRRAVPGIELRGGEAPAGWMPVSDRHANFAADLQADDDSQLAWITRRARAEVRKGLRTDLAITHGRDETHRAGLLATYGESVRNLGTPVFPRALFDAVLERFGEDAEITMVRANGQPVSAVLSLYHAGAVMPYWGGGTRAARALHANERMYYELMCHARRRGATRFDFGRSKTGSGPYAHKKNWGFEPEPLTYWSWTAPGARARNIDPTHAGFSARIELWKRLPLPVANRLGPWIARGLG